MNFGSLFGFVDQTMQVANAPNVLTAGRFLVPGASIYSPSRTTRLTLQTDGNLVLYQNEKYVWDSRTAGKPAVRAILQNDGNFVVYDGAEAPLWASGTDGNATAYLSVYDDGNAMIRAGNGPRAGEGIWSTKQENYDRASRDIGDIASSAVHAVSDAASSIGDFFGGIPLVGAGLRGTFDLMYGAPFRIADNVVSGDRIDRVALAAVKDVVADVRDVAPYVQTVIAVVPGVGPVVSGAISAGLALASGQPIDQALLAGVRGAIPGGALGAAVFDVAVAAAEGRPIADAALAALPIPATAKRALGSALAVVQKVANGERVDSALIDEAIAALPPQAQEAARAARELAGGANLGDVLLEEAQKLIPAGVDALKGLALGLGSGLALGQARKLQAWAAQQAIDPGFVRTVADAGASAQYASEAVANARRAMPPEVTRGFDLAIGLVSLSATRVQTNALAATLAGADVEGFQRGMALATGRRYVDVSRGPSAAKVAAILRPTITTPSQSLVAAVRNVLGKPAVNVQQSAARTEAVAIVRAAAEGSDAAKAAIQGTIDRARNGDGAATFAADALSDAQKLLVRSYYVQRWTGVAAAP